MDVRPLIRAYNEWVKLHSPVLLTGIAVGGVATTGVLAAKGAYSDALNIEAYDPDRVMTPKERFLFSWKHYAPACVSAILTTAAIVAGYKIGAKRQAAVAAALAISEKALVDYRDEVRERLGERKELDIRDTSVHKGLAKKEIPEGLVTTINVGDQLCMDGYFGHEFVSNPDKIDKAINQLNHQMIHHDYASQNDLFYLLGAPSHKFGDDFGWDSRQLLEWRATSMVNDKGQAVLVMNLNQVPFPKYMQMH